MTNYTIHICAFLIAFLALMKNNRRRRRRAGFLCLNWTGWLILVLLLIGFAATLFKEHRDQQEKLHSDSAREEARQGVEDALEKVDALEGETPQNRSKKVMEIKQTLDAAKAAVTGDFAVVVNTFGDNLSAARAARDQLRSGGYNGSIIFKEERNYQLAVLFPTYSEAKAAEADVAKRRGSGSPYVRDLRRKPLPNITP